MAREKESYRDNILRIKEFYPTKEMLNKNEVALFTGLDPRTVKKIFEFNGAYISVASLARQMS